MAIRKVTFIKEPAYEMESDQFKAIVVPGLGSNLLSLYDKKHNVELVRTPENREEYEQRPMLYGTPVLFPPNRIEDAVFTFKGKTYHLEMNRAKENNHIHGFVHNKPWHMVSMEDDKNQLITRLRSEDFPEIIRQFPHSFELTLSFTLTDKGLRQSLTVANRGTETMPVGLGYHTTFNFPIHSSRLQLEVGKQWELNNRMLPTGELLDSAVQNELAAGALLEGRKLDDAFVMTDNKKAVLSMPETGISIVYSVGDTFKHWVVFNGQGTEDFVAVEPYSWITNAPNLQLPAETTGLMGVEPGKEKNFETEITVMPL
ncbi:aldose 1-epimerase [Aneurinibacillus sp. Ricciae_BoGa-3]|uniref:aldose 1-epimerase n=1 Tax=Aneurinibacillus sp. Ricciae_BoGa-3 TaxID=3022697 RepID=UPI00233F9123|nr:aldose 1-epimerase [Aneurinibacillus sp. Ricciae_BoGa-3]WCK56376.1 aldose 1-epimerase [Aneurinibacillus sp. Ricciae_BoGa-3]